MPNFIDLIRLRNVDFSSMMYEILANSAIRMDFIRNIASVSGDPDI